MLMRGLQMICPLEPPFILDPDTLNTVDVIVRVQNRVSGVVFDAPPCTPAMDLVLLSSTTTMGPSLLPQGLSLDLRVIQQQAAKSLAKSR